MKQSIEQQEITGQTQQLCSPESQNKTLQSPKDFRIRKPTPVLMKAIKCEKVKKVEDEDFDFKELRLGKKIGSGAFGDVYVGFTQGKFIAVKQLDLSNLKDCVDNEIEILSKLEHQNIVKYHGYNKMDQQMNLYLEYMDGGSLSDRLKQFGKFNESLMRRFAIQILDGIIYLHQQGIAHRDLKCGNILTNQRGQIKLADFGSARWKDQQIFNLSDTEFCDSLKGSFKWMAPELLFKQKYGRRVDVWSFGCVLIEMSTAEHPWPNIKSLPQLHEAIQTIQCPPIPTYLSEDCQRFIRECFTFNKHQRPKPEMLKEHDWIKKPI